MPTDFDHPVSLMLLSCGAVESADFQDLARALSDRGISVTIAKPIPVPRQAFTERRQQYRADDFLKAARCPAGERVLVMSDCDLYVDGLNFVLGLADGPGNCAVISLCRLRLGVNQETFRQRTLMEAVHELGHLLGLDPCARSHCVMCFSNCLDDTDREASDWCERCAKKLQKNFNHTSLAQTDGGVLWQTQRAKQNYPAGKSSYLNRAWTERSP